MGHSGGQGVRGPSPVGPLRDRPRHQGAHLRIIEAEVKQDTLAVALALHYLFALQRLEVARRARLREADILGEIADTALAEQEQPHELEPGWITQAGHESALAHFAIDHCMHMHNMA